MKRTVLLLSALFYAVSLLGQTNEVVGKGSTAMGFAVLPSDAASLGKAGAGLPSASWASFGDMGAVALASDGFAAGLSYSSLVPGKQQGISAGFYLPLNGGLAVSAGAMLLKGEPYEEFNSLGSSIGEHTPSDMKINAGVSYKITDNLSAAAVFRFLRSDIASNVNLTAFCADLGASGVFGPVMASAGLRNLGPSVKDSGGSAYPLPSNIFVAGEYGLTLAESSAVNVGLSSELYFSAGLSASAGVEYAFKDMVFARAGYHLGNELLPSFLSAGIGLKFAGASIDFAYLLASETIGGSMIVGLGYSF